MKKGYWSIGEECWKDIEGYNGEYKISSHGRVKSHKRKNETTLKPGKNRNDNLFVILSNNGNSKVHMVNRLVAKYFISNFNDNLTVINKDKNKNNNNVNNLKCIERSEVEKNFKREGENNTNNKLTELEVKYIRNWIKVWKREGYTDKEIADMFDVSLPTINQIKNNKSWRHVN